MAAPAAYAYATGERSSRVIERRSREDIAFRVFAAGLTPDHVTIARFRRRHADALIGLFSQVRLCERAGLVSPRHHRHRRHQGPRQREQGALRTGRRGGEPARPGRGPRRGRGAARSRPQRRPSRRNSAQVAVDENHVIVACDVSNGSTTIGARADGRRCATRDLRRVAGRPSSSPTGATGTAKRSSGCKPGENACSCRPTAGRGRAGSAVARP